jgi:dienelactone hydrolase
MQLTRALYIGFIWLGFGGTVAAQGTTAAITQLAGSWEGTVGASRTTRIRFTFSTDSTRTHGTFDALASGVLAWPVRVSTDTGGTLRLTLPNGWFFRATVAVAEVSGTLVANEKSAPFVMRQAASVPHPYSEEPVVFRNGEITLSGTLFIPPPGKEPLPAVVFAHGSGAMDRTADNFLGDYLARRGIIVLLYDKRGVGKSTGEWRGASLEELAADAFAGARLLRGRPDVDSNRVGVAGRSQGGQLAVISAQRYVQVAFAINVSGSLVPPWQQMNYETAANMSRDRLSTADSVAAQAVLNEKWAVARTGKGWDSLAAHVRRLRASKPTWLPYVQLPDKLSDIRDSWHGQMGFDYGPVLAQLTKPVLALLGGRDTSTPTDETVAVLRAGLRESRNEHGTIHVYAEADHALLIWRDHAAELELPSYPSGYPEIVARWIHRRK